MASAQAKLPFKGAIKVVRDKDADNMTPAAGVCKMCVMHLQRGRFGYVLVPVQFKAAASCLVPPNGRASLTARVVRLCNWTMFVALSSKLDDFDATMI